jgi:multidrug transporter EmrE-like cation transporter
LYDIDAGEPGYRIHLTGGDIMLTQLTKALLPAMDAKAVIISLILILANLLFNILANVSFKYSAGGPTWREFLFWQVVGNLAGLITVITLTWLLRFIPLHIAFPVTTGLTVIGVSLVASHWIFKEEVTNGQFLGTLLVVLGIVLLSRR